LIKPFRLRDSLRLQRLWRQGIPLQWERHLTEAHSVLWAAVGAPLAWHGTGAATYLYHPDDNPARPLSGFVQAVKRSSRPEADIMAIAPNPAVHLRASTIIWQELLNYVVYAAGEQGIQRLYVCVTSDSVGLPILTASSFAPYIQETLFRLSHIPELPPVHPAPSAFVRSQREIDGFSLHRLYTRHTPALVQQAEGRLLMNDDPPSPLHLRSWWPVAQTEGIVYEKKGDILAAAHMTRGSRGHWLRLYGAPEDTAAVESVLSHCLHVLQHYPQRPIYCTLRPYQASFGPVLQTFGFEEGPCLTRLVKHTTLQSKQAQPVRELSEVPISGLIPSEYKLKHLNKKAIRKNS